MPILKSGWAFQIQMIHLGPPDHAQYQSDNGDNQQDMNQPACAVYKKTKYPSDNQYNCNEIQ